MTAHRGSLRLAELPRVALVGLVSRRLRTVLSALGVAIGIAAMVAVIGVSDSSHARLIAQLDALGTNMLLVKPGQSFLGQQSVLPARAAAMIGRIDGVQERAALVKAGDATIRRSPLIPEEQTGAIAVYGTSRSLRRTAALQLRRGRWLDRASDGLPTVVLGAQAAHRLGLDRIGARVWIGETWFAVIGILRPAVLAPAVDTAALVSQPVARSLLGAGRSAAVVYVRVDQDRVAAIRDLLAPTANVRHPEEVQVSRPSDALAARAAAQSAYTSLFLGLGAVALLVGGVGIANVLVISVLERRSEIGLRRALGARRRDITRQFLAEALLLSGSGGAVGVVVGAGITAAYSTTQGWTIVIAPWVLGAGVAAGLSIGGIAGLHPAIRASRLSPFEALRTT